MCQRLLLLMLVCATGPSAMALNEPDLEHQIKAAYLYKFLGYVEWPSTAFAQLGAPVIIGVIGADAVATELGRLKSGRLVNNRAIEVKQLRTDDSIAGVHVLYIAQQEASNLKRLLSAIQAQPVLTITDSAGGLDFGSVINFVPVDNRVRFEVSVVHAERSGLKVSARLLAVAQRIETGRP
ncbi:YfiR family protein [Chitinivorax sp. B]|uniref:YfiR family protein n=1 Tax=Chitinivorax sp. B TaxID=2502235 RepID=UPI001484E4DF|nr:YfiR family protein [Chitinivorax sp. B]